MRFNDKVTNMNTSFSDPMKSITILLELESSKSTGSDVNSGGAIIGIR